MICLSWNCRGLASKPKKLALKDLISCCNPDIVFLQETLGKSLEVESALGSLLPGWSFLAVDASGHSGGLAIGIKIGRLKTLSTWGLKFFMGMEVMSSDFDFPLTFVNIYGPCQGRVSFWNDLLSKNLLKVENLIFGGDLNFSMGISEAWGPLATEDPLSDFFVNALQGH